MTLLEQIRERETWTSDQIEAHRQAVVERLQKFHDLCPTEGQKVEAAACIEYAKHATETQIKRMEA